MIYTIAQKNYDDTIGSIFSFDAITSLDEAMSSTVSTQTVEQGFDITDHINIEPSIYSIDGVITSYSLFDKGSEIVWDGGQFIGGDREQNLHISARDKLIKLFKSGQILTLIESTANSLAEDPQTRYKELNTGYINEIENLVMTSLSISHISSGTGAFLVSLKLQEINLAYVTIVELTEDEMLESLIALNKVEDDGIGKKDKKDSDVEDGTSSSADNEEDEAAEIPRDGDWHEVYNRKTQEKLLQEDRVKITKQAADYAAANNAECEVDFVSGSYKIMCKAYPR